MAATLPGKNRTHFQEDLPTPICTEYRPLALISPNSKCMSWANPARIDDYYSNIITRLYLSAHSSRARLQLTVVLMWNLTPASQRQSIIGFGSILA